MSWSALVMLAGACHQSTRSAPLEMIPRVQTPITVDGEWNEHDWSARALRGQFRGDDGQLARPSSEVRLLHDDKTLYVGLYAADDDIRSTDAFELSIGSHTWSVTATGEVRPPIAGAKVAVDRDGTLDDASNNDEEWVIELAIPLSATELRSTSEPLTASRCDVPKLQTRRCANWGQEVALQ